MRTFIVVIVNVWLMYCQVSGHQRRNVAAPINGGSCEASTQLDDDRGCEQAIDGEENPEKSEWITSREEAGSFIVINVDPTSEVDEVRFLQRCKMVDRTREVRLDFSDNTTQMVELSCVGSNSAYDCTTTDWESVAFTSPITTSYVNITVVSVCSLGAFNGFRELAVMGFIPEPNANNLALIERGGTCASSSDSGDSYTCEGAINGVIGATSDSWYTLNNEAIGSWLKISLPSQSVVTRLRFMNRCLVYQQMETLSVALDGGVVLNVVQNCVTGPSNNCPDLPYTEVNVDNVVTTSVNITGVEPCDPLATNMYNGFQDVQVIGIPVAELRCPAGFTLVDELHTCYKFVTDVPERRNITNAKDACSGLHPAAHLAEMNSDAENNFVLQTAADLETQGVTCDRYFTNGARETNVAEDWFWESSGDQITCPNWHDGEPLNAEDYTYLRIIPVDGIWQWASADGGAIACYICEVDSFN